MSKRTFILVLPILALILFIYRAWFTGGAIIGGDWPYYWRDSLSEMKLWPSLWAQWQENGLGGTNPLLGLRLFQSLLIVPFVNWLGLPWEAVYKVGWFGLFIALSVYGSKKLWEVTDSREQRTEGFPWWIIASLVYTTNTYILMVTGGGQMGVAIAYGLAPLVLATFIKFYESIYTSFSVVIPAKPGIQSGSPIGSGMTKSAVIAGLALGFQLMIDPRIAYMTMVGVGMYIVSSLVRYFVNRKENFLRVLYSTFLGLSFSVGIAVLLNAFWVFPMVVMRNNPLESLGSAYTSIDSIKFFSFADFSHALSLLHPNWPENLFGKTYFLQPEFFVLPVLAFASLLYIGQKTVNNKHIAFFALLALIGTFLAKGAQEPFGRVYVWIFEHIPGFVMFRDPTKWYVLIAISYSVLIPFTLKQLVELRMRSKTLLITLFIFFWLFTIREAVLGKLGGTFVAHTVPQEYRDLERFLQAQPNFARTLWVPRQQRFSYGTLDHMQMEAEPLFGATTAAQLKVKLDNPTSMELLGDLGIGYVMIPYDSLGELFLTDRKYDEKKRQEYETVLDRVGWLTKVRSGNLTIYQTPRRRDLFWLSSNEALTYKRIRPDRYAVSLTVNAPAMIYFSQTYHPGWVLRAGNTSIRSQRSPKGLNSFEILSPGMYEGVVEFEPQKYVEWGLAVSLLTVLGMVLAFML